jgi:hypothetical protein
MDVSTPAEGQVFALLNLTFYNVKESKQTCNPKLSANSILFKAIDF